MTRMTARSRALTRVTGVVAALSALCAGLVVATPAAAAATLALTISQQTGTAPFQADDAPGNDSSASNEIVRTNDTVAFTLGIRFEGEDQTAPTVRFTVPQGQELVSLPPFCLAGSSVTPPTIAPPSPPLTATSWQSLPSQQVTCVLANQTAGTALNYPFVTRVRPEVPHGTDMDDVVFRVTSDQVTQAVETAPLSQTVSAAPRFDLSKRFTATSPDQGPLFQATTRCVNDASRVCRQLSYPVSIAVPAGGKGVAPLTSPIRFEDDLNPASFYGAALWAQMVATAGSEAAATAAYAPIFRGCVQVTSGSGFRVSMPYSGLSVAGATTTNSVRATGSISCPSGQPGQNGVITLTNTDTSGRTVPTTTGSGAALSGGQGYIATLEVQVHVPQAALVDFGSNGAGAYVLNTHNAYTNVQMTGLDGTPGIDDPVNNTRDATIRIDTVGTFDKSFTGIYGQANNTPAQAFSGSTLFEGPPGSGVRKDGNTVVMPGQAVQSVLSISEQAPGGTGTDFSRTLVSCDVWDADRLALAAHPSWAGWRADYPSNGSPVYPAAYTQARAQLPASTLGTADSAFRDIVIEYSSGPAGAGSDADCSTGTWSTDPSDIATPVVDAFGRTVWEGVNRVRVTLHTEWPVGTTFGDASVQFAIGQVVLDSDKTEPIGNWSSQMLSNGIGTTASVIADPLRRTTLPTYDPDTHQGRNGDRLIQGEAIVRVAKFVEDLGTGQFVDQTVPQYTSGVNIRYRLDPSLTSAVPVEGSTASVVLEDCLPPYQIYSSATQAGAAISPVVVQMGAPDGAGIACADDRQYVRYDLGTLPVGAAIEPIVVTAEILATARNGIYTNEVLASSDADNSPADLRSDEVQVQLVVPTGIKIAKTVDKPVIEVNPDGVENPRTLRWSVFFANIDSPQNVSNVDVIDVLPATGLNGSDFAGELVLDSVTPVAGSGISVLYTKAAPSSLDPAPGAASNGASGATVWCDAISGDVVSGSGTAADCPSSNDEVTGLRFQRPGAFTPATPFQVDIAMTPVGNAGGDVYTNVTAGRADGVTQGVGPATRTVNVIASSVGDRVWEDVNGDGLQSDGEPGIAGFPVRLIGTDVDGNPVSLETVTDADGFYLFDGLASGEYQVVFDPSGLDSNTTFTTQDAGDDAADSDADPTTGAATTFTLGQSVQDLSFDAGLVIDRSFDMVLDKRFIGATELDDENRSTVTYELDVINNGTAEGTYDLVDPLDFGGDVEIGAVTVENVTPGDVVVNPDYDGQGDDTIVAGATLPGETTHTYRVIVETTVATTITVDEAECSITTTETGGGYLNEAELTVDGTTVTDKACGEIPVPPAPAGGGAGAPTAPSGGLAITGGTAVGIGVGLAALAAMTLGLVLALRRRRQDESA